MRQQLNLNGSSSGKIFHRQPSTQLGPSLEILNSGGSIASVPSARFLQAAWNNKQECLLIGDHLGNLFILDLDSNKYNVAKRCGMSVTSLAFMPKRTDEILVATSDYCLHCYGGNGDDVADMQGHKCSIRSISLHAGGRYAITCSSDSAQLWDLNSFTKSRKLSMKKNVDILQVFFLPKSNIIMTCFKDDTIFAWEADTLTCKYQLHATEGTAPRFSVFAASRDGRYVIGGGKSRFLHLWSLDTHELLRVIELPQSVRSVRGLEFFPSRPDGVDGEVVSVLDSDGCCRFLHTGTCRQLFTIGGGDVRLSLVTVSASGRHLAAVTEDGLVLLYDVKVLCAELQKPPAPLVKAVTKPMKPKPKFKANISADSSANGGRPFVSAQRLKKVLRGYGVYPAKYRLFIWRTLLELPENHAAFGALVDKGVHIAHAQIHEKFPIKSQKLMRIMQRVLSAISNWSPIFGETDFLPHLAFPFIKLSQNNQLIAFELVASLIVNWCSHWFEYFPNPPINVLAMVENVLAHHDKDLLEHFISHGVTSQVYAWPLLRTLFSEVLTADEWLRIMDHVFSNHPGFLLLLVASYCMVSRSALMRATEKDDFKYFFHHRNAVDLNAVIKEAYRLDSCSTKTLNPTALLESRDALPKGQYPIFNKYPKFIVDYQVQERERIRQEELEYLQQRQSNMAVERETRRRQEAEAAWVRQQRLLLDAEQQRRVLIQDEDQRLAAQRVRLRAMERELKLKELQLLDATRAQFAQLMRTRQAVQVQRLDDELQRKVQLRDTETNAAIEDINIRNIDLHLQRNLLRQELEREAITADQIAQDVSAPSPTEETVVGSQREVATESNTMQQVEPEAEDTAQQTEPQPYVSFHSTEDSATRDRIDAINGEFDEAQDRLRRLRSQQQQTKDELADLRTRISERSASQQTEAAEAPHRAILNNSVSESSIQCRRFSFGWC